MSYHFLFYFYLLLIMIHMCLIMILYSWHCYSSCLFFSYPFRLLFLFFFVLLHLCLAYSSCPVLFLHLIAFSCDCCHRHTCCSDPMCRHCLSANPHEWNGFLHAMPFASRPRMSGSSRSAFAWALVMSCNKMPWHHHLASSLPLRLCSSWRHRDCAGNGMVDANFGPATQSCLLLQFPAEWSKASKA